MGGIPKIDWEEVSKKMRKPAWIFDTRSILNKKDSSIMSSYLNLWFK